MSAIFGIGTDIVAIARITADLERFGARFAAKILADAELEAFRASSRPDNLLAKRFAAKEATVKAFGTGLREGISLRDIRVVHDHRGKPGLEFGGAARAFADAQGITAAHLSLSDEQDYAIAFVVLSCS